MMFVLPTFKSIKIFLDTSKYLDKTSCSIENRVTLVLRVLRDNMINVSIRTYNRKARSSNIQSVGIKLHRTDFNIDFYYCLIASTRYSIPSNILDNIPKFSKLRLYKSKLTIADAVSFFKMDTMYLSDTYDNYIKDIRLTDINSDYLNKRLSIVYSRHGGFAKNVRIIKKFLESLFDKCIAYDMTHGIKFGIALNHAFYVRLPNFSSDYHCSREMIKEKLAVLKRLTPKRPLFIYRMSLMMGCVSITKLMTLKTDQVINKKYIVYRNTQRRADKDNSCYIPKMAREWIKANAGTTYLFENTNGKKASRHGVHEITEKMDCSFFAMRTGIYGLLVELSNNYTASYIQHRDTRQFIPDTLIDPEKTLDTFCELYL